MKRLCKSYSFGREKKHKFQPQRLAVLCERLNEAFNELEAVSGVEEGGRIEEGGWEIRLETCIGIRPQRALNIMLKECGLFFNSQ